MATPDIVEWAESKYGFYVDRHYRDGRWVLEKSPIKLSDYHKRILAHIFTPDDNGRWRYDTVAWCEPAKSGKSAIAGLVAEYCGLHTDGDGVLASNKKDQAASLMYKSLTDSVTMNPHLPKVEPNKYEVTFRNGNTVRAIPSNSKGEAGSRFTLACFDELWAYWYEDSIRLWTEFKSDPTRLNSAKFAVGYAGYSGESELWQTLLETGTQGEVIPELADITNDDGSPTCYRNGRQFTFWSHTPRQPWQTSEWLESQAVSLLPAEYRRMIKTAFVPFTETAFVQESWWDSCYDPLVKPIQAGDKTPIVVALDLSLGGLGNDTISMAGVGKWGDGYAVKFIRTYEPTGDRFDYDKTAGVDLAWLLANCSVVQIAYDVYQAHHFIQSFSHLAWCKEFSQQTERTIADRNLYDLILSRRIYHDGNAQLRQHVLNAGSKAADDNKLRIVKTHPRKKIDLGVCLSMACYRAGQLNLPPDPASAEAERLARIQARLGEFVPAPPVPPAPTAPANGNIIEIIYTAAPDPEGSFSITLHDGREVPVWRNRTYEVPESTWANIEADPNLRFRWKRVLRKYRI